MSKVVLKLFMSYHPIQPLRWGNKTLLVIRINLPGVAFSHDQPFEIQDELLMQLFGLAATPGGQLWLSCKQITNYMLFLFYFCLEFVPYWSCKVQANYLERGLSFCPVCWQFSGWWVWEGGNLEFLAPIACSDNCLSELSKLSHPILLTNKTHGMFIMDNSLC